MILSPHELKTWGELNWKLTLLAFLSCWLPVILGFLLIIKFHLIWLSPFFILINASRQHAMAAMAHESVHGLLLEQRTLNDLFGRLFFAFPIAVSLSRYRAIHLLHHKKVHEPEDPDLAIYERYPVEKKRLIKYLTRDITARTVIKNMLYFAPFPKRFYPNGIDPIKHYPYKSDALFFILFHVSIIFAFSLTGYLQWLLILWYLPYISILQVLLRLRGALEHGNIKNKKDPMANTRTVIDHSLILTMVSPLGLNYHLEHHLYPTIPWFQLPKIHAKIQQQKLASLVSYGYVKALTELIKKEF